MKRADKAVYSANLYGPGRHPGVSFADDTLYRNTEAGIRKLAGNLLQPMPVGSRVILRRIPHGRPGYPIATIHKVPPAAPPTAAEEAREIRADQIKSFLGGDEP